MNSTALALLTLLAGFACSPVRAPDPAAGLAPADPSRPPASDDELLAGLWSTEALERGDAVPDFALTSASGAEITAADLAGRTWVLTFFELRSPDPGLCPTLLERLLDVQERLRPDLWPAVRMLALSVDPDHDTPEVLRTWSEARGVDPARLQLLSGSPDAVLQLAEAAGVITWRRDDGTVAHTLSTLVIDSDGRVADVFSGVDGWRSSDLIASIVHTAR